MEYAEKYRDKGVVYAGRYWDGQGAEAHNSGNGVARGSVYATEYVLNTPSNSTNGSGDVTPGDGGAISGSLGDGDKLTLTTASGGGVGQYSIHTVLDYNGAIRGDSGQGNNTIILETGSKVYTEGYKSNGIYVAGTTTDASVFGIVNNHADNTVIVESGASITINDDSNVNYGGSSSGIYAINNNLINFMGTINNNTDNGTYGINANSNNTVNMSGEINLSGDKDDYSYGVGLGSYNLLNMTGRINNNVSGSASHSWAISSSRYNKNIINGDINLNGTNASGVVCQYYNIFDFNGNITDNTINDNNLRYGFDGIFGNIIVLSNNSSIKISGSDGTGIMLYGSGYSSGSGSSSSFMGNVVYVGGSVDAAHALVSSQMFYGAGGGSSHEWWGGSNSFYLLSGANIRGAIENTNTYFNTRSYIINGYATDGATGKAVRTAVDSDFSITLNSDITSTSTGLWGLYTAGGTTTLNGSTNEVNSVFIGADCFDGVTVADGNDGAGSLATANLNSITGATATLTVNNAISTLNSTGRVMSGLIETIPAKVTVGSGSTYNLNGTHTHEFDNVDSFKVLGTLNLGANGRIEDYQGDDAVMLTLGGVAGNGAGAVAGGTINSYASSQALGLKIYNGSTGTVNVRGGNITLNSLVNNGAVDFNVGRMATLVNNTGGAIDLSHNKGTLTLDFGDISSTSLYARTSGAFKSSGTSKVDSIYGINGVAGTTYSNVFDTQVVDENGNAFVDGTELNNVTDSYRLYKLSNNGLDVLVENSNRIREDVLGLGGSEQEADAANYLVENQGSFDAAGQLFVDQLTALSGNNLLRGSQELIGNGATSGLVQSQIQTIGAASGAVRNQLTSFRMGGLASGLASSFSAAGSTAATGDMADAEELSVAYNSSETGSTGEATVYRKLTIWANGFGGFGEQGTEGDIIGYDFWNAGTMVGMDYAFSQELRIGGLFGYSYNKTEQYAGRGDSTDSVLRLGGYSSYNWDGFFVDFAPTMGIHMLESKRNLITNGLTAKGERTALDFNLNGTVGYTFTLPADISFTPSYSLGYTFFHDPEYTEKDAAAGNLAYKSFDSNSLLQDIGIKFGRLFRVNEDLAFLPEAWGGWEVEYLNTGGNRSATTSTSIGGNTYSTAMAGLDANRGYWGAGFTALIKDNVSVFGRYDHKLWSNGFNVGFSAGIKISF